MSVPAILEQASCHTGHDLVSSLPYPFDSASELLKEDRLSTCGCCIQAAALRTPGGHTSDTFRQSQDPGAGTSEVFGQYSHPRKLSRPRSSSQLGSSPSRRSVTPDRAGRDSFEQQDGNAFAAVEAPALPVDSQNSFAQQEPDAPAEEPQSPGHRRFSSSGSADLVRLNALGGYRRVFYAAEGDEQSTARHHSEVHHPFQPALQNAFSRDDPSSSARSRHDSSRAITPKDSKESQASYASRRSTDPSSSDVDEGSSTRANRGSEDPVSVFKLISFPSGLMQTSIQMIWEARKPGIVRALLVSFEE